MEEQGFDQRDKQREREKKNKYRTIKIKQKIASEATLASETNRKIEKRRNPESMVSERVEIADVKYAGFGKIFEMVDGKN